MFDFFKKGKVDPSGKRSPKSEKKEEEKPKKPLSDVGEKLHQKTAPSGRQIIAVKPFKTEKGTLLSSFGQYLFEVAPSASKHEIKEAVQMLWNVHPMKIRIMNVRGRKVRYGRAQGKTSNWKKAVVTLPAGEKIE